MIEEADALMHCSVQMNLFLKSCVTLLLLLIINVITFGVLLAVLDTPTTNNAGMWICMLFDSASLTLPFICIGLYSKLPLQERSRDACVHACCMHAEARREEASTHSKLPLQVGWGVT